MYLIKLIPAYKDYLWGGDYLKKHFNKKTDISPLAESWEFSTHPNGNSIIANGIYKGLSLTQLLKIKPRIFGKKKYIDGLPILVKLIDAHKDLSIQVHPSDEYASKNENQNGKTEMWYILDAVKDASIVYGFEYDVTKNMILNSLKENTFEQLLHYEKVKKGDCIYIPSGMIHALGKGIVVAEIQESSDVTYRLYDYNRVDKNGKKRELHIDKALEVLNYNMSLDSIRQKRTMFFSKDYNYEILCKNEYFSTTKYQINSEINLNININIADIYLFINGNGIITSKNDKINVCKGDCVLVPSNYSNIKITGNCEFLKINY